LPGTSHVADATGVLHAELAELHMRAKARRPPCYLPTPLPARASLPARACTAPIGVSTGAGIVPSCRFVLPAARRARVAQASSGGVCWVGSWKIILWGSVRCCCQQVH